MKAYTVFYLSDEGLCTLPVLATSAEFAMKLAIKYLDRHGIKYTAMCCPDWE